MIVCAATQKPGADVVPSALRDLFGFRLALRCNTPQASDTILGQGWASAGCGRVDDPGRAARRRLPARRGRAAGPDARASTSTTTTSRRSPSARGARAGADTWLAERRVERHERRSRRQRRGPRVLDRGARRGRRTRTSGSASSASCARAGYCRRPVRLRGRVDALDARRARSCASYSTEHEPDGTLLKCCGNRREAVCPSCAETYRGDAFQLVAAGMRGGKGVPESVAEHPVVFVTLTAPSFGPVHSRRVGRTGRPRRCRPRRDGRVCPHGVSLACGEVHDEDDPRLGEPLCPECFDYEHAVLWNALAPELWRRTAIQLPRELARLTGVTQRGCDARARVRT